MEDALLGVKIQGFGTAEGARGETLTFADSTVPFRASSVSYKQTHKSRIGSSIELM